MHNVIHEMHLSESFIPDWIVCMQNDLIEFGESSIWQNQAIGEYKRFKYNSYRRLVDLYIENWYTQFHEYSSTNCRILKKEFGF